MGTAITSKHEPWDFDAFCAVVHEDDKADLIGGVIFMASPENLEHYRIKMWLMRLLEDYLTLRAILGEVFGIKIAFRLDAKNAPEPDIAYVSGERLHLMKYSYVDGPPDWVAEIASPDSIDRDYNQKLLQYERFGVGEYLIIDPLNERLTCYRLGRNGKYKLVRARKGTYASKVIPGFWVRPSWFWQTPPPTKSEILNEIIAAANGQ
jgi:Uma2 family endonuclease